MDEIDLTDEEQRVFETVSALEVDRGAVRADDVAGELEDIDPATAQRVLSRLTSERELLRELSSDGADLGPSYRVKDTAGCGAGGRPARQRGAAWIACYSARNATAPLILVP